MAHVPTYRIFGREVGAHVLSMATLGTAFVVGYLSMPAKKAENGPPINAKSKEEESFVKSFIQKAEGEKK